MTNSSARTSSAGAPRPALEILQLPYFQRYVTNTEPLYAVPRTVLVLEPVGD